jgi:hypothetical protein
MIRFPCDPDRLDESQLDDLRRELAGLTDAALARTYEIYRMACGLRADGIPRMATMQHFWESGKSAGAVWSNPVNKRHSASPVQMRNGGDRCEHDPRPRC